MKIGKFFTFAICVIFAGCKTAAPSPTLKTSKPPTLLKAAGPPALPPARPKMLSISVPPATTNIPIGVQIQATTDMTNWQTIFATNLSVPNLGAKSFFRALMTFPTPVPPQPPAVLTYHYDLARSGANTNETVLRPAIVNTNSFGKLFSCQVDNWLYAQPLFVPGVAGHNVIYAASLSNTVYAFDADDGGLLWSTNLGTPVVVPAWTNDFPSLGILSTPAIDLSRGLLYAVAWKQPAEYDLHAINVTNGADRFVSIPAVTNGAYNPWQFIQRSAITIVSNNVFVPWACASEDGAPSCIMSFDADTLAQKAIWFTGGAGIWMSGCGPASDGTNIYFATGNNPAFYNPTNVQWLTNVPPWSYPNSVVKLGTDLSLIDYFCPSNTVTLSLDDSDLGSGGVLLLPGTNLLLSCGKQGRAYLLDRNNLGGYDTNMDHVVQEWGIGLDDVAAGLGHGGWSTPAYFNGLVYYYGYADFLKSFQWTGTNFNTVDASYAPHSVIEYPDSTPVISANGTNSAICWYIETAMLYNDYGNAMVTNPPPAIVHAFDAYDLSNELWNSDMNTNDTPGQAVKFTQPVVVNGKVYVGSQSSLTVYGLK